MLTPTKSRQLTFISYSYNMLCPASDVLFILGSRPKSSPHLRPAILVRERVEQCQDLTMPLKASAQSWHKSPPFTFDWPKQVTWPSPLSVGREGSIPLPQEAWQAIWNQVGMCCPLSREESEYSGTIIYRNPPANFYKL